MPAKSKDQQRAAGIALQAKREGTVEDLPKGSASYQMAKSMSEEELDKLASTKHKGLPKDVSEAAINEIVENWEKALLVQEEMLGLDDEDEQIATQNPKPERIKKRNSKKKAYKDKWPNAVPPTADNARSPMTNNTRGARVAEQVDITLKDDEKVCPTCNGTGLKDGRDNRPSPMWQPDACPVCNGRGKVKKDLDEACGVEHEVNENFDPNSLDLIFEKEEKWMKGAVNPAEEGEFTQKAEAMGMGVQEYAKYVLKRAREGSWKGDEETVNQAKFAKAAQSVANEGISFEQSYDDWDMERFDDPHAIAQSEVDYQRLNDIEAPIVNAVVETLKFDKERGKEISKEQAVEMAWDEVGDFFLDHGKFSPEAELLFAAYEDKVPPGTPDNVFEFRAQDAMAEELGERAWEEVQQEGLNESIVPYRWKKLAGVMTEMNDAQAKRYVRRLAQHGWEWEKVAEQLKTQYGLSPYDVAQLEKDYRSALSESATMSETHDADDSDQPGGSEPSKKEEMPMDDDYDLGGGGDDDLDEAMVGGVSNSTPNPGHRAKMNEV